MRDQNRERRRSGGAATSALLIASLVAGCARGGSDITTCQTTSQCQQGFTCEPDAELGGRVCVKHPVDGADSVGGTETADGNDGADSHPADGSDAADSTGATDSADGGGDGGTVCVLGGAELGSCSLK